MAESSYDGCAPEGSPRRQSARESAVRTYARSLPVVRVRARGLTIEGADGRRYLDCHAGGGTLPLGHNHPAVLEAIRKVLDSGAPLHTLDLVTPVEQAFAAELLRTLPPGLAGRARVQFCGAAGTDAIEAALRLVRTATGRTGILTFTGADHAFATPGGATAVHVTRLPSPQDYRCPFGVGGPRGAELAARWTQSLLDDPRSGVPDPAGTIVEPVQSEGGILPAPDIRLQRLRQITAARSIPLIADETHTGVGRTGAFRAVEHSEITSDVLVLSPAIGGSLPLAAIVYRDDLAGFRPHPHHHTSTLRGNQLALAAGTATLTHVRENHLAERASLLGARMLRQLQELRGRFACVGDVRGRGLMLGVERVEPEVEAVEAAASAEVEAGEGAGTGTDTDTERGVGRDGGDGFGGVARLSARDGFSVRPRPAAPELAAAVQRECLRRGLIVELGGRHVGVVRLLPPLTITDEQVDAVLERLADAVESAARAHTSPAPAPPRDRVRHRHGGHTARAG